MNEMQNAHLLLTFARDFFRGSLKSSNKTYSNIYGKASASRKQKRIANGGKAGYAIGALRAYGHASQGVKLLLASDQGQRAGNCCEYASIALRQGVDLKIPNIWFARNNLHGFIILAEELPASMLLDDFRHCTGNSFWVCDPWCNLFCEMHQFPMMIMAKAQKWTMEGKEIYLDNDRSIALGIFWAYQLLQTKIFFDRMTDSTGKKTELYKKDFTLSWSAKLSRWWRS
ncbi:hypothetical protein [Endozoicomonas euniceicola]|uniref:Uncharacterized protein n=1 Tax=Endozoicomonas euniceicola TaxID=1234143 RepID=A0ABY6H387_9GAMM|nr:hypothetical protein [Endozoicomonas euniceicola]UYM18721.1 hypothetical protein NX720_12705 [Endozoicomonas euniceicola]